MAVNNNNPIAINIATGKIATNILIDNNRFYRLNTSSTGGSILKTDGTTNTGMISDNYIQTATTTGDLLLTANAGISTMQNFSSGVVGASGFLLPAADS
jgi:hypothetical protein